MKTQKVFLFLFASLFIFFGCQPNEVSPAYDENIPALQEESLLIERDITDLSESHALNVAKLFRQKSIETKVGSVSLATEDITPVYDAEGQPLMYVVNFENKGGYIIVSATKKYFPVLAFSDQGYFDMAAIENTALSIWMAEMKANIIYSKANATSREETYKMVWYEYELPPASPQTKVTELEAYAALCNYWYAQGATVIPLAGASSSIPTHIYNDFVAYANSQAAPNSTRYVVRKYDPNSQTKGPLLSTAWHQGSPFNAACPPGTLAGCVAIALGQIMNYHQKPSNLMGNDAQLIADIGTATFMNYGPNESGSITTITNAVNALRNTFGYSSSTIVAHNLSTVASEINANRPVFMSGYQSGSSIGHAWVCDGRQTSNPFTSYYLAYIPAGTNAYYSTYGPQTQYGTSYVYHHLNMGEQVVAPSSYLDDAAAGFSTNRQDIVYIY